RALPVWALVGFFLAARRRAWVVPVAVVMAAADLTALMLTAHKEERFLYPACVLLAVAAAPAVAGALTSLRTRRARTLAVTGVLAVGLVPLAFAPDVRGDQFRALVLASRPPATGLLIVNEGLWGAGGYFYLGRRLPWLTCDWPQDAAFRHAVGDPRFNRAITFEGRALAELQAAGFRVVGQVGRETLLERPANAKGPRGD
ncbi:MAG: mannosyltransferase, partial [Myxococcaceae bacterium]|nr:mannosyltransferase [Myxococcaceae bacterium]